MKKLVLFLCLFVQYMYTSQELLLPKKDPQSENSRALWEAYAGQRKAMHARGNYEEKYSNETPGNNETHIELSPPALPKQKVNVTIAVTAATHSQQKSVHEIIINPVKSIHANPPNNLLEDIPYLASSPSGKLHIYAAYYQRASCKGTPHKLESWLAIRLLTNEGKMKRCDHTYIGEPYTGPISLKFRPDEGLVIVKTHMNFIWLLGEDTQGDMQLSGEGYFSPNSGFLLEEKPLWCTVYELGANHKDYLHELFTFETIDKTKSASLNEQWIAWHNQKKILLLDMNSGNKPLKFKGIFQKLTDEYLHFIDGKKIKVYDLYLQCVIGEFTSEKEYTDEQLRSLSDKKKQKLKTALGSSCIIS
jgi:hypothetical protein